MKNIQKVLIANRGEIAVRVIHGARKLGLRTVAVYSDADRQARHVQEADQAVRIGPPVAAESYLRADLIIDAARASGAQAIHPGYGFLAENAEFARQCEQAGLIFIGPSAEAIDLMGNKRASKIKMIDAGVPCVPGYEGTDQSDETLLAELKRVGCPVMVKAAAGGGGRGMRLCNSEAEAAALIKSARSEAESAFGSGELILEKAVVGARHVEIQVFGDTQGNVVHLGERDCSVQRRHQKVVEESPSPAVDSDLRSRMGEAAVQAARSINYVGAGTVEFLLAADGEFYFLEMNTRLQVEHPVTELVTGVDLVEWQLRIANGEALPLQQAQISQTGHAIEVRLCAEDVRHGDIPQTGHVASWRPAQGEGVRIDHGIVQGTDISPYYDSMIAKIIAWGHDRDAARGRLRRALVDTSLHGVITNIDLLRQIIEEPDFAAGNFNTGYMPAHFSEDQRARQQPDLQHCAVAAVVLFWDDAWKLYSASDFPSDMSGWMSSFQQNDLIVLKWEDQERSLELLHSGRHCQVKIGDSVFEMNVGACDGFERQLEIDGVRRVARYSRYGSQLWLSFDAATWCYTDATLAPPAPPEAGSDGKIRAGSDGKVVEVMTQLGNTVEAGQTLVTVEAMKMEFQLTTPVAGKVTDIHVGAGEQVANRQLLVELDVGE